MIRQSKRTNILGILVRLLINVLDPLCLSGSCTRPIVFDTHLTHGTGPLLPHVGNTKVRTIVPVQTSIIGTTLGSLSTNCTIGKRGNNVDVVLIDIIVLIGVDNLPFKNGRESRETENSISKNAESCSKIQATLDLNHDCLLLSFSVAILHRFAFYALSISLQTDTCDVRITKHDFMLLLEQSSSTYYKKRMRFKCEN